MNVQEIPIDQIIQVDNSRNKYKQHELEQLMASMKKDGQLQNIGVRISPDYENEYIVNFGNRRLLAAKKLGWSTITCSILDEAESEADYIVYNLIENEMRSDVNDLERGRYFQELISDKHGLTVGEVAIRTGISKAKIQQCIRLHLEIPTELRKKIKTSAKGTNGLNKGGHIPVSLADLVVTKAKKLNFTKSQKEKLLNFCREDGINKDDLKSLMNLMSAGGSFERSKKKVDKVKTVTISIPVLLEDWDFYIEQFGTADKVRQAICKTLYGIDDSDLVFQKPY